MKKLSQLIVLVLLITLSSCSKPKSLSTIPKETDLVLVVDAYSLIKKADLADLKNIRLAKKFNTEVKSENKQVSKIFEELKDDPFSAGIDFFKDVFVYYTESSNGNTYVVTAITLKNGDKFTDFIQKTLDRLHVYADMVSNENYKYIVIESSKLIAWDDDKVILIGAAKHVSRRRIEKEASRLFSLSEANQIGSNEAFTAFYKDKKDISLFGSSNLLKSINKYGYKRLKEASDYDIDNNYLNLYLDFQDDQIALLSNVSMNKSLRELLAKHDVLDNSFDKKLLRYLPKKNLFVSSLSVNPMAYYDFLESREDFERMNKAFEKEIKVSIKTFFESIGGNAALNWSDVKKQQISYKKYDYFSGESTIATREELTGIVSLSFDVKNKETLQKVVIDKLLEAGNVQQESGYYSFKFDDKFPAYFALNDKMALISNELKTIQDFVAGKSLDENLLDSSLKSDIIDNHFFTSLVLDTDVYPYELTDEFFFLKGAKVQGALRQWNAFAASLSYRQQNTSEGELVLQLKKGDNNSLNRLIRTADGIYTSLME